MIARLQSHLQDKQEKERVVEEGPNTLAKNEVVA